MNTDDLVVLLENRTDLEKLEQDLAAIDAMPPLNQLSREILQQVQKARHDLEIARAGHIALNFRLSHPSSLERIAAREDLLDGISAGVLKFFDPQTTKWLTAAQLLINSYLHDEELTRREVHHRLMESTLQSALEAPHPLSALHEMILQIEELESLQELTPQGSFILRQARQAYETGKIRQRELTLLISSGTLTERFGAISAIREQLTLGETQILEAFSEMWRPIAQVLDEAVQEYERESGRVAAQALNKAEGDAAQGDAAHRPYKARLKLALQSLYLALDKTIPYAPVDRQRLENRYLELLHSYEQATVSNPDDRGQINPDDLEGFKKVSEMNRQRMKNLYHQAAGWLNHFLNSALTQTPAKLLKEAYDKATPVDKTISLIDMAVTIARKQLNVSIEIPEVMVRGAGILFDKSQVDRASDLLDQAKPLYTFERVDKIHRYAVTRWMSGCLDYYQGRRLRGYSEWKEARGRFNELLIDARRIKQSGRALREDRADWYKARLVEMDILAVQTFEEVYFQWMNQVDPISLTGSLAEYRKMMDSQFGRTQFDALRKTIQVLLQEANSDYAPMTYWITLIEAAFFEYQISDYCAAISHLEDARVGFHQGHRHAVTLWLTGMVRWWLPSQWTKAVQNWEESIQEFKYLADQANKSNNQGARNWYETQLPLMSTALRQWIVHTRP